MALRRTLVSLSLAATAAVCACTGGRSDDSSTHWTRDGGSSVGAPPEDVDLTPGSEPRSGTQVKVRGWTSEGSLLGMMELWDERHGVVCELAPTEDGVTRCLPPKDMDAPSATCSWFESKSGSDCGSPPEVRTLTSAEVAGTTCAPQRRVYRRGALCADQSSPDYTIYAADPVPADEFVAFERTVIPVTEALGVDVWVGTDGSRIPLGLRDRSTSVACAARGILKTAFDLALPERSLPCVPEGGAEERGFTAGCTQPVYTADHCTKSTLLVSTGMCLDYAYWTAGVPVDASTLLYGMDAAGGSTCVPVGPAGPGVFQAGDAIDPSAFPGLELRALGRSSTVKGLFWTSGGKTLLPLVLPVAGERRGARVGTSAATCRFLPFTDGKTRCVSDATFFQWFYSDAACTRPAITVEDDPCISVPTPKWAVVPSACRDRYAEVRPVGAPPDASSSWSHANPGSSCQVVAGWSDPAAPATNARAYTLGDPVDADTLFPEVTVQAL